MANWLWLTGIRQTGLWQNIVFPIALATAGCYYLDWLRLVNFFAICSRKIAGMAGDLTLNLTS